MAPPVPAERGVLVRLAGLGSHDPGDPLGVALEQLGDAAEDQATRHGGLACPGGLGIRGGRHRGSHVGGVGARYQRQQLAGRRIQLLDRPLPAAAPHSLPAIRLFAVLAVALTVMP